MESCSEQRKRIQMVESESDDTRRSTQRSTKQTRARARALLLCPDRSCNNLPRCLCLLSRSRKCCMLGAGRPAKIPSPCAARSFSTPLRQRQALLALADFSFLKARGARGSAAAALLFTSGSRQQLMDARISAGSGRV